MSGRRFGGVLVEWDSTFGKWAIESNQDMQHGVRDYLLAAGCQAPQDWGKTMPNLEAANGVDRDEI
jgi:hypothetical protein